MDGQDARLLKKGDYVFFMKGPYFECPEHLKKQVIGCVVENGISDEFSTELMCKIEWDDGDVGELLHSKMGHIFHQISHSEMIAREKSSITWWKKVARHWD